LGDFTPKERVLAAFEHEPTDKVPIHHLGFSSQAASHILRREAYVGGGIQQWREAKAIWEGEEAHREFLERSLRDAFDVAVAVDNDILRLHYWRLEEKPSRRIDEYTFLYGDPDGRYVVRRFVPSSELFNIIEEHPPRKGMTVSERFKEAERKLAELEEWAENYRPRREEFQDIRRLMEKYGEEYAIRINGGTVGIGLSTEDPIWLMAMVARPELAARYLDVQAEVAVKQMRYYAEAGVKTLFGGCDIASDSGPCFPSRVFRELVLPRLQRVVEECHKHGMYFLYGSDGNVWPIAEDLFGRSGVDGYYEIDRRAGMDLRKLRRRFPDLVLIGNISSYTLHFGAREEVVAEALSCLREAKRSRGVIVGVSNYIVPGTPRENIIALIETIRRHR
jgi:uroporphyrinogen-III decarboxylase